MSDNSTDNFKELLEDNSSESQENGNRYKWSGFVESTAVNFFDQYKIEKMSLEDGNGNKAKLSRTKDNGIKIEYSSTILM